METSYGVGQYSGSGSTEAHQWAIPYGYRADGTRRLVVWGHSAGGLAPEPFTASLATLLLVEAIVSTLGLPLISLDASPPSGGFAQHWGNDVGQSRVNDAISYAASTLNARTDRVIYVGVSMGGMLGLNWARANPTKVAALALLYPATGLQAIHDGTGGAANGATATEAAYGGSTSTFNAAVTAHDPAQNAPAIAALGVPLKMYYSTADATVGTANQLALAAAVGPALQTRSLGAVAHADMSQVPALDLQAFVRTSG